MTVENTIKAISALVGLAGFIFGVIKFLETRAVEAKIPYLEKKLVWCERAVETTAKIATSSEISQNELQKFWQMYWGVMGLIEKETITAAMVEFGNTAELLSDGTKSSAELASHLDILKGKSLALAHACRKELSSEWSPSWGTSR